MKKCINHIYIFYYKTGNLSNGILRNESFWQNLWRQLIGS